ncbi:MAG: hypothetical protein FWJ59_02880 [Caldicoprobacter sp.]|uniref:hypothetical protein n=1 Tax=Caldicoprobacter sp. TaxID=2004500 RepID=UPI0039C49329
MKIQAIFKKSKFTQAIHSYNHKIPLNHLQRLYTQLVVYVKIKTPIYSILLKLLNGRKEGSESANKRVSSQSHSIVSIAEKLADGFSAYQKFIYVLKGDRVS